MTVRTLARWVFARPAINGVLALGLFWACSTERLPPTDTSDDESTRDDSEDAPTNGEASGATQSDPNDAPDADAKPAPECEVPQFTNDAEPEPFESLSATVVDETGAAVADTIVQACGLNVCLQGNTSAQGRAVIKGDEQIEKLAFKYGDGLHYAQVALAIGGETVYDLGEQRTVKFPAADPDNRFDPGSTLVSSGASLALADNTETVIDVLSYADSSEHLFVAKAFEADAFPQAAEDQEFVSLWALGPAKTEFCPPPELALPNLSELESGAKVDLLLLVTDVSGRHGRYAEWQVVAVGTVSKDGDLIVTDEGRGIPELGLIGVRPQK